MAETPPMPQVEVVQADREAAADAIKAYRGQKNGDWQGRVRRGEADDGEMVQAFARHRIASIATLQARIAEADAKMRMIVSHATGGSSQDIDASVNDICVRISANRNLVYQSGKDRGREATATGFRSIGPSSPEHAAVLADLARRIDDE